MSNIASLRSNTEADLAARLRMLADEMDAGEIKARNILLIFDDREHDMITTRLIGPMITCAHAMGLCTFASNSLYDQRTF